MISLCRGWDEHGIYGRWNGSAYGYSGVNQWAGEYTQEMRMGMASVKSMLIRRNASGPAAKLTCPHRGFHK